MDHHADMHTPAGTATETTAERVAEATDRATRGVRREVQYRADEGRKRMAATAGDVSHAGERAAVDLEESGHRDLAEGLRYVATRLSRLADVLHQRTAGDLLHEAEDLAKRNPALFIGGSIALGFILSRAIRSTRVDGAIAAPPPVSR